MSEKTDKEIEETLEELLHAEEKPAKEKNPLSEKTIEDEEFGGVNTQEEYEKLTDEEKQEYGI